MKKLLAVFIGLAVLGPFPIIRCMAGEADKPQKHLVPADKGLSKQAIQQLYEGRKRQVYTGKDLETIGMPVGGIGAGQLYLRGDGTLACWQIFNRQVFSGYWSQNYRTYRPDSPVDSGFAVIVEKDGKALTKTLDQNFGTVEFGGEYPLGLVRYRDEGFPLSVSMQAYSPLFRSTRKIRRFPRRCSALLSETPPAKRSKRALWVGLKMRC